MVKLLWLFFDNGGLGWAAERIASHIYLVLRAARRGAGTGAREEGAVKSMFLPNEPTDS
jgi:hypothetical protein